MLGCKGFGMLRVVGTGEDKVKETKRDIVLFCTSY